MLVLDSSAAVELVFERPKSAVLRALSCKGERVIAPELYLAEMTHVIEKYVRGHYIDASSGVLLLDKALHLVDEFIPMSELVNEVFTESLRLGHSAYDVFYFVLARRNAATLCTLDQRLQQLCLKNGVNCFYDLGVEGGGWTIRAETEAGPGCERGYTREELERAVCRDANGV